MTVPHQTKAELKQKFISEVSYLLQLNELKGTSLCKYLVHFAKRWHVPYADLDEIIMEGVRRGLEYIENNDDEIKSPEAWLRRVCLNILKDRINEIVKRERKTEAIALLMQSGQLPSAKIELVEQLEFLEQALNLLSPEDRLIIRLKFIHGKNYKQIQYQYELQGELVSIPALRKRESRALNRLREHFFSLYNGGAGTSS